MGYHSYRDIIMQTSPLGFYTPAPFGNFLNSLQTTFFVVFGNNWNPIYFELIHQKGFGPVLYFLTASSFGKQLLFNFIVAFLLQKMEYLSDRMRVATRLKYISIFQRAKMKLFQMKDRKDGTWLTHLIANKVHQDTNAVLKNPKVPPTLPMLEDPISSPAPNFFSSPALERNNPLHPSKLNHFLDDDMLTDRPLILPVEADGLIPVSGQNNDAKLLTFNFPKPKNSRARLSIGVLGDETPKKGSIADVPAGDFSPEHPPVVRSSHHKASMPPMQSLAALDPITFNKTPIGRRSGDRISSVVPISNSNHLLPSLLPNGRASVKKNSVAPKGLAMLPAALGPQPKDPKQDLNSSFVIKVKKSMNEASQALQRTNSSGEAGTTTRSVDRLRDSSLFLLHVKSPLRKTLQQILSTSTCEMTIALMIILVAILLAIDSPSLEEGIWYSIAIRYLDILLNAFFSLEILARILAYGGIFKSKLQKESPYFHKLWNLFDFSVVMLSWVTYMIEGQVSYLRSFKVLRILRLMGPIRSVLGSASLDLIIEAIFASTTKMITFTFFILLCCQPFTVMALHKYPPDFNQCQSRVKSEWFSAKRTCDPMTENRNMIVGFKTYFGSLFYSIAILTNEGFKDLTHYLLIEPESYQIGVNQVLLIFLAYYLMGCFLQNMYACLTILNYKEKKQNTEKTGTMSPKENMMFDLQKLFIRRSLPKDSTKKQTLARKGLYSVINHVWFDVSLLAIFFANVAFIIASGTGESPTIFQPIRITQLALLLLYNLEMIIKVSLQGPRAYISDHFNKIDFISAVMSDLLLVLYLTDNSNIYYMAPILLRFFTIGRFLRRLIFQDHPISRGLKSMLQALNVTLVSLAPLLLLVFIVISLFSIIGMNLFYKQPLQSEINSTFNFRYFFSSFLLLLKTLTGFRWDVLVREISESSPGCRAESESFDSKDTNQCGQPEAYAFFIAYLLISRYLLANLVTVLVIDGYLESKKEENLSITENKLDTMYDNWARFSPSGNGLMKCDNFILFLNSQVWPCGVKPVENLYITPSAILKKLIYTEDLKIVCTFDDVIRTSRQFPLTVYEKDREYYVHFVDYIAQLCSRAYDNNKAGS